MGQDSVKNHLEDLVLIEEKNKLMESVEIYKGIFESISDIYYKTDLDGKIILVSPSVKDILGYSPDEVIGTPLGDLHLYPEKRKELVEVLRKKGEAKNFEAPLKHKDGTHVWLSANTHFTHDQEGNVTGVEGIVRNVTERYEAEDNIRRLAAVLKDSNDAITVQDLEGNITAWNRGAEQMYGWSEAEALKMNIRDIVPEGKKEGSLSLVKDMQEEEVISYESSRISNNGTLLDVWITVTRLVDDAGKMIAIATTERDITEYKRTLEELKERVKELDCLYTLSTLIEDEEMTLAILFRESIKLIIYSWQYPEITCARISFEGDEFSSDNFKETEWMQSTDIICYGKKVGTIEVYYLEEKPDIEEGPFHKSERKLINAIAERLGQIIMRKKSEEQLLDTRDYLDKLLNYSSAPVVVWNPKNNITRFNKAFELLTGYSSEEVMGQKVSILFPDATVDETLRDIGRILSGDKWESVEIPILCKNGEEIYMLWNSANVYAGDNMTIISTIAQGHDITERKRTEQARTRLLIELDAKNKEMEQMVYVASHDLRSPLVNIQGFSKELQESLNNLARIVMEEDSEVMKNRRASVITADIDNSLKYILSSTSKMDKLLNGLLQLSRLGRVTLTLKELDMNALVSDVVAAQGFHIKEKDIELKVGELPGCLGDHIQIDQVFSNLLENARKYLDPERQGIIRITGEKKGGQSVYCVEDNGIGIAPEHKDKVFEIFHSLDQDSGGEGLGLTIVRRILDRHGGKIWLESEVGWGTKFYVSLAGSGTKISEEVENGSRRKTNEERGNNITGRG